MNNCPKCGNPLQVGTSSCPICGTNILATTAEPAKEAPAPVAPAPAAPAVVQVTEKKEVVTAPTAQVVATPAKASAPAPVVETTKAVEPKVETQTPAPVAPAPTPTVAPVATETVVQPTTVEPTVTKTITESEIAPTIKTIDAGTPVPSIPASLSTDAPTEVEAPTKGKAKKARAGIKINKNALVIGIVVIAALVGVYFMTMGNTNTLKNNPSNKPTEEENLASTSVSSHGYKINLADGWVSTEDGQNVVVTNINGTVAIKLDHNSTSLESITKETIEGYFQNRTEFSNTKVSETTISAKKAYLVDTNINSAPVQVYFISGTSSLTLGATVVYQSEESKTKYEAEITKMIGTLTYSDESLKAMDTLEMYANIFNVYNGVMNYTPTQSAPTTPETPEIDPNQPNNETPQNNNQTGQETPEEPIVTE